MRKKYGRIAVFVLGCVLAVWGMIIYPILHRGTIIISITNQTDNAYTIVRINDQSVGELLEADGMIDVDYVITQSGPITAYFEDTSGQSMERLLTEGMVTSVSPENYGRIVLTFSQKKGNLELKVLSNISS